jgi:hypothetical protein
VIQSAVTMLAYGDRVRRPSIEPEALAEYWIDRIERLLRACVRDRSRLPDARTVDVLFHEFMADDMGAVEAIYRAGGVEFDERARRQLQAFIVENPRGKHGQVLYDLQRDFGVAPEAVRERFAFYFDRFPVRAEGSRDG